MHGTAKLGQAAIGHKFDRTKMPDRIVDASALLPAWRRMMERLDQRSAGPLDTIRHHEYLRRGSTDRAPSLYHTPPSNQAFTTRPCCEEHGLLNDNRLPIQWCLRNRTP